MEGLDQLAPPLLDRQLQVLAQERSIHVLLIALDDRVRWYRGATGVAVALTFPLRAGHEAVERGFAHGLDPVRASTDEPNVASVRVLERLGFTRTRVDPGPRWPQ